MKNFSTTVDTMGRYESDLLPIDPENPNPMPGGHQGPGVKPIGYQDPMPGGSQGGAGSSSGGSASTGNSGSNSDGAGGTGDSGATNTIAGTETGNGDNMTVDTGSDGTGSGGASDSTGNSGPQNGSPDIDKVGENMYDDGSGDSLEENTNPTGKKLSKPSKKDKQEKDGAPLNPIPHVPQTDTVAPGQTLEPPGQQPSDKKEDGGTAQEGQNDEEQLAGTDNVTNAENEQNEEQETLAESDESGENTDKTQSPKPTIKRGTDLGVYNPEIDGKMGTIRAGIKPSYIQDTKPNLFHQRELEEKVITDKLFQNAKFQFCYVTSLVNTVSKEYTLQKGKLLKKDVVSDVLTKLGNTDSILNNGKVISDTGLVNNATQLLDELSKTIGLDGTWSETRIDGYHPDAGRHLVYKTEGRRKDTANIDIDTVPENKKWKYLATHFSPNVGCGSQIIEVYNNQILDIDSSSPEFYGYTDSGLAPIVQTRLYTFSRN